MFLSKDVLVSCHFITFNVISMFQIVLVPNMDTVPIFQGQGYPNFLREEFLRYGCYKSQLKAFQEEPVDICRNLTFSISSVLHGRALG